MITGDQIIHRRGSVSGAVRYRFRIPWLSQCTMASSCSSTVGLLNNLPANVDVRDTDGEVICVDFRRERSCRQGFGSLPPFRRPPPAVGTG